jgi:phage-related protein
MPKYKGDFSKRNLMTFSFLYKHGRRFPGFRHLTTVEAYSVNGSDFENKNTVGRIPVGIQAFVSYFVPLLQ